MRTGAAWPNSGGSTMTGKSGLSVKVRSTTRTAPDATAPANCLRPLLSIALLPFQRARLRPKLTLDRLGIRRKAPANVLCDIAHEHVLESALERRHDGGRDRAWRHLRRRHRLEPFNVQRPREHVHHLDATGPKLRAQAVR